MGNEQGRVCASIWQEDEGQNVTKSKKSSTYTKTIDSKTNTAAEGGDTALDLNDPELQDAAVKIQKVFRGHAVRKKKLTARKASAKAAAKRKWEREDNDGEGPGGSTDQPGASAPRRNGKKKSQAPPPNKNNNRNKNNNNNKKAAPPPPKNASPAAVVESPPLSYRSGGDGNNGNRGSIIIELNNFQGLEKAKSIYVVFDIEEMDDRPTPREERRSRTVRSQQPSWNETFNPLPVEDISVQALRINLYEKRTMRKDHLLGFADIDLGNLSPDVIGEVETELENNQHDLWGLLTLTVQFVPDR